MFVADDTVLNELASIFATSPRSAAATGAVRRAPPQFVDLRATALSDEEMA
jgi:hypothetical protein